MASKLTELLSDSSNISNWSKFITKSIYDYYFKHKIFKKSNIYQMTKDNKKRIKIVNMIKES